MRVTHLMVYVRGKIKVEQNKWTCGGRRQNEVCIEKHDHRGLIEKMRVEQSLESSGVGVKQADIKGKIIPCKSKLQ